MLRSRCNPWSSINGRVDPTLWRSRRSISAACGDADLERQPIHRLASVAGPGQESSRPCGCRRRPDQRSQRDRPPNTARRTQNEALKMRPEGLDESRRSHEHTAPLGNPLGEKMTKLVALVAIALMIGVAGDSTAQTSGTSVVRLPNEIVYKGLPGAPQHVTLFGDPTKPGLYVDRIKLSPGTKNMPHWHPDTVRTVLVLSGTLYFA